MGDRNAAGAVPVVFDPDYEAMVIGAHPDDCDFSSAATSALLARQGKKVVWVIMTDGTEGSEVPSADSVELMLTREQEQRMACEVLGVQAVEFLRFPDGHLTNNDETRRAVVRLLRKYRPRIVITHDPSTHFGYFGGTDRDDEPDVTGFINHSDHRTTGSIVLDAIYPAAGNPRAYRELLAEGLQPYKVHEIYLFGSNQPNIYINVTETIELKGKGLQCHVSQLGPDVDMIARMKERAAMVAKEAKEKKGLAMQYAESFRRIKLYIPPEARS
jgi:LmbE family N-acetylglucosaminyl deacetylase